MTGSTESTVVAASAWTIFGISLTQINTLLQTILLTLSIIVTIVTLALHAKNFYKWVKEKVKGGIGF